jgi:hypothetical protein
MISKEFIYSLNELLKDPNILGLNSKLAFISYILERMMLDSYIEELIPDEYKNVEFRNHNHELVRDYLKN